METLPPLKMKLVLQNPMFVNLSLLFPNVMSLTQHDDSFYSFRKLEKPTYTNANTSFYTGKHVQKQCNAAMSLHNCLTNTSSLSVHLISIPVYMQTNGNYCKALALTLLRPL